MDRTDQVDSAYREDVDSAYREDQDNAQHDDESDERMAFLLGFELPFISNGEN